VEDRPLATGAPRRPLPLSMTMCLGSDNLQPRGPEELALALTWQGGIRRSATEARKAELVVHENHSHLCQLMETMTLSTEVSVVKRSRRDCE
jgi:hypothetical protein